jgi:glycosyltransferase involved in cell wall biosynthesis
LVGGATRYQRQIEGFIEQKNLQTQVKILNQVPFADLPALYQGANLFAYLSVFEGFGIPIVEALHSQVPVLAATGSCLEEAGGEGAIYVNPLKINEIADSLELIWNDTILQKKLTANGHRHVEQLASSKIAYDLMTIYKSLL